MGKLTKVQLDKINNECGNDFELDLAYFKATDEIRFIILIKICKWEKSETLDVWVNQGMQKIITAPELTYDRKLLKHLQKLSHQLDDEKLKSLTFE